MASFTTLIALVCLAGCALAIPTPAGNPYGAVGGACPPNNPELNKKLVLTAFNRDVLLGADLEQYYHTDLIQHDPLVADGLDALRAFAKALGEDSKPDLKRVAADGDLVWLHLDAKVFGQKAAIVDIFRIECGKIKEHWDVIQDQQSIPKAANSHPFF